MAGAVSGDEARLEYAKWICETKRGYADPETSARAAARRLQLDRTLKALYSYRCSACQQWHLTKSKTRYLAAQRTQPQPTQEQ